MAGRFDAKTWGLRLTRPFRVDRDKDRVQARIRQNNERYTQTPAQFLLKGLAKCGDCGSAFCSYRRYVTERRKAGKRAVYHRSAYACVRAGLGNLNRAISGVSA
jgi:hypothetical protein